MKKGNLSIQYIFLITIGVISVFIIIGMLGKWSLNSDNFLCKLTGDCNPDGSIDKQTIKVDSIEKFENEIVKHAKLCFQKQREGSVDGELCYTVKCDGCRLSGCSDEMIGSVERIIGEGNVECDEFYDSDKAIIEYDQRSLHVIIR